MRDWDTPMYKRFRLKVKRRDKFKCILCGSKNRLEVHHIKKWADYPQLRYIVSNGVTLCKVCHESIKFKEEEYEAVFIRLVRKLSSKIISSLIWQRYNNTL